MRGDSNSKEGLNSYLVFLVKLIGFRVESCRPDEVVETKMRPPIPPQNTLSLLDTGSSFISIKPQEILMQVCSGIHAEGFFWYWHAY